MPTTSRNLGRHRARWLLLLAVLALLASACGSDDDNGDAGGGNGGETASGCEVGETDGDLALYNWAEYIDPEHLDAFAAEFGISATMTTYESNETMLPTITAGNAGYDVIVPSDYMVGIMIDGGFIQKLDFDAIPNASNLSDDFRNPSYDPTQEYSLPYQWGYTGLAVNTAEVGTDFPRSWDVVFGDFANDYAGKITLLNDPRETLGAALKALGYSLNTTDQDELNQARDLVGAAKGNLLAFNTDSSDELLTSGESVIAHVYSGDAFTQFLETDDPSQYVFFVPEEGGTRWVDNMAIPFDAPHPCTAHTFINWLYDADQGAALSNWNYYGTPNKASIDLLDEELNEFLTSPDVLVGGPDSVESIADTGDFETNYADAFTEAKG
ncbi:MAG: spermidine/putrescine ABC transporter substrate-binding protein [Acidimicrobiales bacterium]|nr:spermidine/putrescine ABC transporter substrate-binding protein [Acidimicrobiales bacterium]